MIKVVCPGSRSQAGEVVSAAMGRSCSQGQVTFVTISDMVAAEGLTEPTCWVLVDPLEAWTDVIVRALSAHSCKAIIFGTLPFSLASYLHAKCAPLNADLVEAAKCAPAVSRNFSQSDAIVHYTAELGGKASPVPYRPFLRYDFTDEWNNLGYGAITADASIWSLAQLVTLPRHNNIAEVRIREVPVSSYAGLWDMPNHSILWFNRSVGPVDSQEWALVEHFIANYRFAELPCCPVVCEVPYGFDAAVTMRLDCDEDVESARSLWQTYVDLNIPFSLALHATVLVDAKHHVLPKEVLAHGGAVLSHTATHAPNWGGSYEAAFQEGTNSVASILAAVGHGVKYAVSPFHQTPAYARAGLADAGYVGCIGGIIRNDPDFLTARAGQVPGTGKGFIGHSQQCMLHGDCVLDGPDPLKFFKQAFDEAKAGGAFFGYLDHPFSSRYQYGWDTEARRIDFHKDFISYILRSSNVLLSNESDAMDFLAHKASVCVAQEREGFKVDAGEGSALWPVAVEYRGQLVELTHGGVSL
jgi:hypothetical protein